MKNRNVTFTILFLALGCLALLQRAQAVVPAPDGAYPGGNTAEGQSALLSLTTGGYNTAVGFFSLRSNSTNSFNTAIGAGTLLLNTADENTAVGAGALLSNTTGSQNTANGALALISNTTGVQNTANGADALFQNTTGSSNTANGALALISNTTGSSNTANGADALFQNTTGLSNTANGAVALNSNTTGAQNTAVGVSALENNTTGSNNIALGTLAGQNLTTGDYNIDIGNLGVAGDAQTIRIGDDSHQGSTFIAAIYGVAVSGLAVVMDSSDHLGTVASSRRFKEEIRPMDKASEAILSLKPVSFRYKKKIDPAGTPQLGLVAEDVEKVNPDLVVRDKEGKPYSVRYDQVNAMLLNEFLKEHRKVEEQQAAITQLKSVVAQQQKEFQAAIAEQRKEFEARLKQQDTKIQRVSTQLELNNPTTRTVSNN